MTEEFVLGQKARAAGYQVSSFETISSTNTIAVQSARESGANLNWYVAGEQTAGRGRRGRQWQSLKGNLAASLSIVLPPNTPAPELLGFVAGVAFAETIKQLLGEQGENVALKWPNDLLLSGAKLAGILLESEMLASGRRVVIVGFGLNVKSAPGGLAYPTACLNDINPALTSSDIFTRLSDIWVECFDQWNFDDGRTEVLARWRDLAAGIGHPIEIVRSRDTIAGIFETIDEHGRLIVRSPSGTCEKVTTGDVQF